MVVSADFEKQQQYFDKNIALSKFCNIALSFYRDEGLRVNLWNSGVKHVLKNIA
jgi:hypothetical protein